MSQTITEKDGVEQALLDKVENEMLLKIINLLDSGTYTLEKAQEAAREYLTLTPFKDPEDFHAKLKAFTDKHIDLKIMYLTLLNFDEEKKTGDLLLKMRSLMKDNKIEEALKMAQT